MNINDGEICEMVTQVCPEKPKSKTGERMQYQAAIKADDAMLNILYVIKSFECIVNSHSFASHLFLSLCVPSSSRIIRRSTRIALALPPILIEEIAIAIAT